MWKFGREIPLTSEVGAAGVLQERALVYAGDESIVQLERGDGALVAVRIESIEDEVLDHADRVCPVERRDLGLCEEFSHAEFVVGGRAMGILVSNDAVDGRYVERTFGGTSCHG